MSDQNEIAATEINRRKILWLSHLVPYPPKGGVLQRSYNLLRELACHHDVYLLALTQPDLLKSQFNNVNDGLKEAETELGSFCKKVCFLPLHHLDKKNWKYREAARALFSLAPYSVSWLRSKDAALIARDWHVQNQFDIVHVDTISLMPLTQALQGVKVVLNHHNVESHMMLRRAEKETSLLKKLYFFQEGIKLKAFEAGWCDKAVLQLVCSELDADRLQEILPRARRAEVVENGVDLDYFNPVADIEEIPGRLIFAGGLGWYPNLDAMKHFALDIWPRIVASNPHVTMDVIGRGRDSVLEKLANEDPRFRVHGFVDDVRPYLTAASVYVCPIRDGGGTKLKVLDAMAMGKPMVAYPEACEGIGVENGQQVVIADNKDSFANAVLKLVSQSNKRIALAASARELVENKYSFKSIGKKMAASYAAL